MAKKKVTVARKSPSKGKPIITRTAKKAAASRGKAVVTKRVKPKATRSRKAARKFALPRTIIETSPLILSTDGVGPTFDQIQVAAYHRWIQYGGSDLENWTHAEDSLRRTKE